MIVRNVARYDECGDVIESKFRHNFAKCSCGNLSVDGGTAYLRRLWGKDQSWTELSVEVPDV